MPSRHKKKRRRLPKDIADRSGHEIMEIVFGKRVMREVDTLVENSGDAKKKSKSSTEKE